MRTKQNMSILFWICKNRIKKAKAPIYARLTINCKRVEIFSQIEIDPQEWDAKNQAVMGNHPEAWTMNLDLTNFKAKIQRCCERMEIKEMKLTADNFRREYFGIKEKPRMLVEIIQQHNDDIKKLVGKDYPVATWSRCRKMGSLVKSFIIWKFKKHDIGISDLTFPFITDFELYLKVEMKINPATNPKYIKNL